MSRSPNSTVRLTTPTFAPEPAGRKDRILRSDSLCAFCLPAEPTCAKTHEGDSEERQSRWFRYLRRCVDSCEEHGQRKIDFATVATPDQEAERFGGGIG